MPPRKQLLVMTRASVKDPPPGATAAPGTDPPAPSARRSVEAGKDPKPRSSAAPAGSKDAGEVALRETAEYLDRIFPLEQRCELLAELAVLPEGVPEDQISARLKAVQYANELSGIVTVVQAKAAEAGQLLPVIRAAGPPDDQPWVAPPRSTPEEAAHALVAEARPMDGWKPQPKPPVVLKPAFTVQSAPANGNGDHA